MTTTPSECDAIDFMNDTDVPINNIVIKKGLSTTDSTELQSGSAAVTSPEYVFKYYS